MVRKVAQSRAERKHPHALPLARPVPPGVKLRASRLAHRRRERRALPRELMDRMAAAVVQARSRQEHPHTLGGAVKAIAEDPFDPVRRLLLGGLAVQRLIGPSTGRGTCLLGLAEMPEHAATDDRGEGHLLCQTAAVFFIGQDIGGQGQATPDQHGDQTLLT